MAPIAPKRTTGQLDNSTAGQHTAAWLATSASNMCLRGTSSANWACQRRATEHPRACQRSPFAAVCRRLFAATWRTLGIGMSHLLMLVGHCSCRLYCMKFAYILICMPNQSFEL